MIRKVYGAIVNIAKVITARQVKCDYCQHETPNCQKLYVKSGSTRTICVELK